MFLSLFIIGWTKALDVISCCGSLGGGGSALSARSQHRGPGQCKQAILYNIVCIGFLKIKIPCVYILIGWIYRTLLCCWTRSSKGHRDSPGPGGGHQGPLWGTQTLTDVDPYCDMDDRYGCALIVVVAPHMSQTLFLNWTRTCFDMYVARCCDVWSQNSKNV